MIFFQIYVCHLEGSSFYLDNMFCQQSQHDYFDQIFG